MIIKRLTLHNFGVYAGTNSFEFSNNKPIVLIAGLNGRGKTTFLEAVLLALYGSHSFAYKESAYKTYGQYLRSFVNRDSWTKEAYVELEFSMEGEVGEAYLVRREWNALGARTREEVYVEKDGVKDEFLIKNWAMFIENVLPSALSNFFFFDGEKIAELAVDSTNNQLKESIRGMLGLSVLDLLKRDINRNLARLSKKQVSAKDQKKVDTLQETVGNIKRTFDKKQAEVEKLETKYASMESEIAKLKEAYAAAGGTAFEERQKMELKRSEVAARLEQVNSMLYDVAASELPMVLVRNMLTNINDRAKEEHDSLMMGQTLKKLDRMYKDYQASGEEKETINRFISFVNEKALENAIEGIFNLSNKGLLQVDGLLSSRLGETQNDTRRLVSTRNKIQEELDQIDSYLAADIDEGEIKSIFKKLQKKIQAKYALEIQLNEKTQERAAIEWNLTKATTEYQRAVEEMLKNLEMLDDQDREKKYSHVALKVLDEFSIRLQRKKVLELASTITECYGRLANKKNLIHRIEMDASTLDITYIDYEGHEVPKKSLSAGEKQLMVISILWALAICSKKKLPVIIDTPLSRLDSAHRTALITTYFPNASDQVIILSTDSEIDRNYYELMKDNVGDEFTLVYDDQKKRTTITSGYFQEVAR